MVCLITQKSSTRFRFKIFDAKEDTSHVFLFIFLIIFILLLFGLFGLFLCLLLVILFLLAGLLFLVDFLPFGGKLVSFCLIISDDDVVKDGLGLHLPQIEANEAKVGKLVHCVIIDVLRIVDLFGLPETLVLWIGNPLGLPVTL